MMDGNHINSVSGILKIFFGNLAEPLFSETYFDQFMNITSKLRKNLLVLVMLFCFQKEIIHLLISFL